MLKKVVATFRAQEWWSYKLPPILGIAYATSWMADSSLVDHLETYGVLLLATVVSAIYVSSINDLCDIKIDLAAGKKNRLAGWKPWQRALWMVVILILGGLIGLFLLPRGWTVVFYLLIWLVFTLYSVPPFRFKERPLLGIMCDGLGAHGFASLFMVAGISAVSRLEVWNGWWWGVLLWSFCVGLRGILWHQFLDRPNDILTNTTTFAVRVEPSAFLPTERLLFLIELVGLGLMISYFNSFWTWIMLVLYILLVAIRYWMYEQKPILIINHHRGSNQVLMIDYYQLFFPWTMLLLACMQYEGSWIVALLHLLLFPTKILAILKDGKHLIKKLTKAQ